MTNKPNVLLIMTDQHNRRCFGYAGHPDVRTPNFDSLAANGVSFGNAFCQNGICVPSRVSLLTGQYPTTHGVFGSDTMGINDDLLSMAVYLQNFGYETALIGKKHLTGWNTHGFEYERLCYHADAPVRELHYYNYLKKHGLHAHYDDLGDVEKFCSFENEVPEKHSLETWTGDEAIKYLKEQDNSKPFFAEVSFERPHPPFSPSFDCPFSYDPDSLTLPENTKENVGDSPFFFDRNVELKWSGATHGEKELRIALARYYALISSIDQQVGRIIEELKQSGKYENTVIIFTSDHGDYAGEYSRMAKGWNYDAIHNIPMIWHMPDQFKPGKKNEEMVEEIDVFPTICDMLNIHCPKTVQGQSLLPILKGKSMPQRDTVFFEYTMCKTVRTKTHKLSYGFDGKNELGELFDLEKDPYEYVNLFDSSKHQDIRQKLIRKLLNWQIEIQQPCNFLKGQEHYPPTRWFL